MCTRDDLVEARISGDANRRWATADGDQAYSGLAADCPYCVEGGVGVAEQDLRDACATRRVGRERGTEEGEWDVASMRLRDEHRQDIELAEYERRGAQRVERRTRRPRRVERQDVAEIDIQAAGERFRARGEVGVCELELGVARAQCLE